MRYKNIFIIAPSHYVGFKGLALSSYSEYATPLGNIKVNKEIVNIKDIKSVLENIKHKQLERNKIVKDKMKKIKENYGINNLIDNLGENLGKNGIITANSL